MSDADSELRLRQSFLGLESDQDAMLRAAHIKEESEGALLERGAGEKRNGDDRLRLPNGHVPYTTGLTERDKRAMILLIVLYLLQGIPVGLAFGSIPYLLRARLSYSQIGIFSLASYPYSLKLLWSPIVDAIYNERVGRRKSWIIPIQTLVGCALWWFGNHVPDLIDRDMPDVRRLTLLFFTLVFFAATQDIAVDGWALELLSQQNLSYASTAQTIGLNSGYFLSFTVFLAFNSIEFSNKYFRSSSAPLDYPLVSLAGYLKFWAVGYLAVTAYLVLVQTEEKPIATQDSASPDIRRVYSIMIEICKQKHVQSFLILHLVVKIGMSTNDAATSLKLLEKGLSKEDLALAVLIDFPFQIVGGWVAAKWSSGKQPLRPWITATWIRLSFAVVAMFLVGCFPKTQPISTAYFLFVIACTVLSSFASTVQFVGISAFHTQIADPVIGGTYMTLLNTVSNLGGTWPRYFVLRGVDAFTEARCESIPGEKMLMTGAECVSDAGKAACKAAGGQCILRRDGYYPVSSMCILIGALLIGFVCVPTARRLQALPPSAWKVKRMT